MIKILENTNVGSNVYLTVYHEYPIYEAAEGGYYYAGSEYDSHTEYNSIEDLKKDLPNVLKEYFSMIDRPVSLDDYDLENVEIDSYFYLPSRYIGEGFEIYVENDATFKTHEDGYKPYE